MSVILSESKGCECAPDADVKRRVVVLPNDYENLENLPQINGVNLLGKLKSEDIHVLGAEADDYEDATFDEAKEADGYMIAVTPGEKPKRVPLKSITQASGSGEGFITSSEIDKNAAIGSYQFIEKKIKERENDYN